MSLGSESTSVQRPFVRYAVAASPVRRAALAAPFTLLLHHLLSARLRLRLSP